MAENYWLESWQQGRIGFHLEKTHPGLKKFWPMLPSGSTVLVPLCGKSLDLLWLEQQGLEVIGVELAEAAVLDFCHENQLEFSVSQEHGLKVYSISAKNICLYVADFFDFARHYPQHSFAALYDRAALVALTEKTRADYVSACQKLLATSAKGLLITLQYPQELMPGPPFSVSADEVQQLWQAQAKLLHQHEAIETLPKAKSAGVKSLPEMIWQLSID